MIFNRAEDMESADCLDSLEPYFPYDLDVTNKSEIEKLHSVFCNDFLDGTVYIDDKQIKVFHYIYSKPEKDGLPLWFADMNEKFVHIITRDVKSGRYKTARKIREFRSERANRVHWLKPIIENCNDRRIRRFRYRELNGREREYLWFIKGYMVVLEFIDPEKTLITGFCVDESNQADYLKKYNNRIR
jgi:hypothetical protein